MKRIKRDKRNRGKVDKDRYMVKRVDRDRKRERERLIDREMSFMPFHFHEHQKVNIS